MSSVSEVLSAQTIKLPKVIVYVKPPAEIFAELANQLLHARFSHRQLMHSRQSRDMDSQINGSIHGESAAPAVPRAGGAALGSKLMLFASPRGGEI
jgi:hypothetical protein